MLGYREWRLRWDVGAARPVLQSTYMPFIWPEARVAADLPPEDELDPHKYGTLHGIHACLAWYHGSFLSLPNIYQYHVQIRALGAVDLEGHVVEHRDGVIRGERARVLAVRPDLTFQSDRVCDCDRLLIVTGPQCSIEANNGRYAALRKTCLSRLDGGCNAWLSNKLIAQADEDGHYPVYYDMSGNRVYEIVRETSMAEIGRQLCEYYEVPPLPSNEGPWLPPLGAGPTTPPEDAWRGEDYT